MAHILYSYVGELAKFEDANFVNTPDGMRWCRPILIDALLKRGHRVTSLQPRLESVPYPGVEYSSDLPDADVVFCEWRWETYRGRTPDLARQREILSHYHNNIPVILYDAAYQIKEDDEREWSSAVIADPGIDPKFLTRRRERLFFWTDNRTYLPTQDPSTLMNYGYVGNDYDRSEVFNEYYIRPSKRLRENGVQTVVFGNWIERSPARPHPEKLISTADYLMFGGRLSFNDSMRQLNRFIATTHLCKPEYDKHGNITIRFTESLAVGTPGLVPSSFLNSSILGKQWCVSSAYDVIDKVKAIKNMTCEQRQDVVAEQSHSLTSRYDVNVDSAVQFIESKIR